ncbi:hypothetical protein B0H16DRAFT_1690610 [Mycena metata]|uniref:Uncharacterized protein n=1 Tax=Mycena metata TaxID=1033252 RepID=A0AAD7IZT1_9AGAR|nr:hypothetical protein B0H16DRAFT_1690610 [Mycena metata]
MFLTAESKSQIVSVLHRDTPTLPRQARHGTARHGFFPGPYLPPCFEGGIYAQNPGLVELWPFKRRFNSSFNSRSAQKPQVMDLCVNGPQMFSLNKLEDPRASRASRGWDHDDLSLEFTVYHLFRLEVRVGSTLLWVEHNVHHSTFKIHASARSDAAMALHEADFETGYTSLVGRADASLQPQMPHSTSFYRFTGVIEYARVKPGIRQLKTPWRLFDGEQAMMTRFSSTSAYLWQLHHRRQRPEDRDQPVAYFLGNGGTATALTVTVTRRKIGNATDVVLERAPQLQPHSQRHSSRRGPIRPRLFVQYSESAALRISIRDFTREGGIYAQTACGERRTGKAARRERVGAISARLPTTAGKQYGLVGTKTRGRRGQESGEEDVIISGMARRRRARERGRWSAKAAGRPAGGRNNGGNGVSTRELLLPRDGGNFGCGRGAKRYERRG